MKYLAALSLVLGLVGCGDAESPDSDAALSLDASGSATIDAATDLADARPATDAMPSFDAAPACSGVEVGGACWHKGNTGESCSQVCANRGGADPATITFAGSVSDGDRSNSANCGTIVAALSAATYTDGVDNINETNNFGCVEEPGKSRSELISVNATTEASSNALVARICACNN